MSLCASIQYRAQTHADMYSGWIDIPVVMPQKSHGGLQQVVPQTPPSTSSCIPTMDQNCAPLVPCACKRSACSRSCYHHLAQRGAHGAYRPISAQSLLREDPNKPQIVNMVCCLSKNVRATYRTTLTHVSPKNEASVRPSLLAPWSVLDYREATVRSIAHKAATQPHRPPDP